MLHSHPLRLCHQPQHLFSLGHTGRNLTHYSVKPKAKKTAASSTDDGVAAAPPPQTHRSRTQSMPPEKVEIFKSLNRWAEQTVLPLLKPVEQSWQPHDFLPDSSLRTDVFELQVRDLRQRASELPDEYLVVLVGDMITEEALPTYQTMANRFEGVNNLTGASPDPWATWTRGWTAEENRHGDLLRTYLYLSGRVNMPMIERTIQYLIADGMDTGMENNPYLGFVYTSFQERATSVSHGNTARLAKEHGETVLARICGTIAADEKRHENAYIKIVEKLIEVDPNDAILGIANMMRKKIVMPAYLMYDGHDPNLFDHFAAVAQSIGVYTKADYADILDFLVERWKLEKLEGLNSIACEAQEFVCGLAPRFRKLHERAEERARKDKKPQSIRFSWIFDKEVTF